MINYANPAESVFTGATYTFIFGAYSATVVRVFNRPGCVGEALELAAGWLAEHAPGRFVEPAYAYAAEELGVVWDGESDCPDAVREAAEADLTHTETGWLASWEWSVDESDGEPFEPPRFHRSDVAQAHALYWAEGSAGCRALDGGRVPDRFEDLSENGQAIYRALVLRAGR